MKYLTILILLIACTAQPNKVTAHHSNNDDGWIIVAVKGNCTLYRKCVDIGIGCKQVFWSVCGTGYSSSVISN